MKFKVGDRIILRNNDNPLIRFEESFDGRTGIVNRINNDMKYQYNILLSDGNIDVYEDEIELDRFYVELEEVLR